VAQPVRWYLLGLVAKRWFNVVLIEMRKRILLRNVLAPFGYFVDNG
jgi:hypothetical protein